MDAAVAGVLGVVLLLLAGLLAAPLARRRPAAPAPEPAPAPPLPTFPDDDLPSFRAAPPGTPGAAPPQGRPAPSRTAPAGDGDGDTEGDRAAGRVLLALAAAALALIAVLALLAGVESVADDDGEGSGPAAPPAGPPAPVTSDPPVPPLPTVPDDPLPGERGAGTLAMLSVPLDDGGWAARLVFEPLVLEPRAVGATVTVPAVGVTRRTDGTALAHVRLPTWNCLSADAPPDPAAAGCTPGPVEYADLPSPALRTTVEDGRLRLTGRFPTYTRPAGSVPVYTGRVYELTVTVAAAGRHAAAGDDRWAPAEGTLFLGLGRAESLDDPGLSAVRRGG
ncbi:hypothetical protein [Trujillonella humicola]|uniref:hypothetical protein n=1 Tax=Trujillonella humicola TaxID=3383699 RepID=UPI003905CE0A